MDNAGMGIGTDLLPADCLDEMRLHRIIQLIEMIDRFIVALSDELFKERNE